MPFQFDLRARRARSADGRLADFFAAPRRWTRDLKARAPEAGVTVEQRAQVPALAPETGRRGRGFARRLAGDNGPARVVSFAAEAGQFQEAGFSTVICGPGSIDQAHQPDEYVEAAQLERGAAFMSRLAEAMR